MLSERRLNADRCTLAGHECLPPPTRTSLSLLLAPPDAPQPWPRPRHRQLPLQQPGPVLVPQLGGGPHALQPLPPEAGRVAAERVGPAQSGTLHALRRLVSLEERYGGNNVLGIQRNTPSKIPSNNNVLGTSTEYSLEQ